MTAGAIWPAIAARIADATASPFTLERVSPVGGGCINDAHVLEGSGRRYFVKVNRAERADMFAAEAEGLAEILATGTVRVPQPLCHGVAEGTAWLALEHMELGGRGDGAELGRRLAALHRVTSSRFGWTRDNTIGSTPQPNTPGADWIVFYREHRLRFQLALAAANGFRGRLQAKGERLLEMLPRFFGDYAPPPSLLHGDLWSGNYGYERSGEPVLFDPAVYYGDREADLAMTELFGGFPPAFYGAYESEWPLDAGYRVRKRLYNLYHVLNHANLFGGGYASQAESMVDRLLAELR
jgi:fructosamine-3-kinase